MQNIPPTILSPLNEDKTPKHSKKKTRTFRTPFAECRVKYVDDLTLAESVDLRTKLIEDLNPIRPLTYHSRTSHILPADKSELQKRLDELMVFADTNTMKINDKKN